MSELTGKTALVTGASRGIGRAIAERLGSEGALVAVHYGHDEGSAASTVGAIHAAGGRAFAVRAEFGTDVDVDTLFTGLEAALREHNSTGLDILVNNAGVTLPNPIEKDTPESYDRTFAVNARALYFVTQRALDLLRDGGRIINISSGVTRIAFPEAPAYAMTKGAVEALTLALAKHLGPRRITVNSVSPGIVDTDINAAWLRDNADAQAWAASRAALGRVGTPDDVAGPVAFLASDAARWVTGTTVDATGGSDL